MHTTPLADQGPPRPARSRWRRAAVIAPMAAAGLILATQPALASGQPVHNKLVDTSAVQNKLVSVPNEPSGMGGESAVTGGALFGGNAPLAHQSTKLGRHLAIVRIYDHIGDTFPGKASKFLAAGATALVSLDVPPNSKTSYADIVAGRDDKAIRTFLTQVNRAAVRYSLAAIYVSFEHEPDNHKHMALGSAAEFVKAWDHVHQLAAKAHLNWKTGGRLHWVWIVLHSSFSNGLASQYWPGTSEVSAIGVDGYNSLACRIAGHLPVTPIQRTLHTPAAIYGPAVKFAKSKAGTPLFITEWGSDGSPAAQAAFIKQMQSYVASNPEIAAAMYWDSNGKNCHYSLGSKSAALTALATMGHSSPLSGRIMTPWSKCGQWWKYEPQGSASVTNKLVGACPVQQTLDPAASGNSCWNPSSPSVQSGIACAEMIRLKNKGAPNQPASTS